VNQDSEQNEVDGTKKGADSTGEVIIRVDILKKNRETSCRLDEPLTKPWHWLLDRLCRRASHRRRHRRQC